MFHKAVVTEDMVLLGQSAQQFYPFPRELFASDENWRAFQTLVREKAPRSRDKGGRLLWTLVPWGVVLVIVVLLWTAFQ